MRWVKDSFIVIIIVALLAYVLKDIDFFEVYVLLTHANPLWLFLAVLASFGSFVLWAAKWRYLMWPHIKTKLRYIVRVTLGGAFFNTITPVAGAGGEPFRAYYISERYKKSFSESMGYIVADRFFQLSSTLFFVIFSLIFTLYYVDVSQGINILLWATLVGVFLLIGLLIYIIVKGVNINFGKFLSKLYRFTFVKRRFKSDKALATWINKHMGTFSRVLRKVIRNKEKIIGGLIYSFIYWVFAFLIAYFLFLAFGEVVSPILVIVTLTLGYIYGSISMLPGGFGASESVMILMYSAMGVALPLAFAVTLLTRVINYSFAIILGGYEVISLKRD